MIALVLWLIGWPLSLEIGLFYLTKRRALEGRPPLSREDRDALGVIFLLLWVLVGLFLLADV